MGARSYLEAAADKAHDDVTVHLHLRNHLQAHMMKGITYQDAASKTFSKSTLESIDRVT